MRVFRSALTACVIKDLPDVAYYMPLDRDRLPDDTRAAGSETNDTAAEDDAEYDDPTFTVSVFGHDGDDDYDDYDDDDDDDDDDDENDEDEIVDDENVGDENVDEE